MLFVTGPSGVGKSFLVQGYHREKRVSPLLSVNTRPLRQGETERNRTISKEEFSKRQQNGELCLISENHGNFYAYVVDEISRAGSAAMIEIDSKTAILEQEAFGATIVRVNPSAEGHKIVRDNILNKRDNIDLRMREYQEITSPEFLSKRRLSGDILFQNDFDENSFQRFVALVDAIIA